VLNHLPKLELAPPQRLVSLLKCVLLICSGAHEVHDPPVLLALWGELVVEGCSAAVDPVGCGGAVVLAQSAVWQVQHGAPLEGLQAGRGNEA